VASFIIPAWKHCIIILSFLTIFCTFAWILYILCQTSLKYYHFFLKINPFFRNSFMYANWDYLVHMHGKLLMIIVISTCLLNWSLILKTIYV
jgi:hypothetical protein